MAIDTGYPVGELRKSALFEQTRSAPESDDGTSWSSEIREGFAADGFWDFWEVGTCYGRVLEICKYCGDELTWVSPEDAAERGIRLADGAVNGFYEDLGESATCRGDDDGNNEGELHVLFDNSNGHPTDSHGLCQLEACDRYGDVVDSVEGPMMNYWYPIGDSYGFDPDEAALKLADLPLCVVQVSGDYGLALTGGGMDLTWEIVEAFVVLGYLPPLAHNDPPKLAGKEVTSEENGYLLAACRESITFAIQRLTWDLERHDTKWSNA